MAMRMTIKLKDLSLLLSTHVTSWEWWSLFIISALESRAKQTPGSLWPAS